MNYQKLSLWISCFQATKQRNRPAKIVVLPTLIKCKNNQLFNDMFLTRMTMTYLPVCFCVQATRQRDRAAVSVVLPTLIHCENDRAYEDTYLHCLVAYLIPCADDFAAPDFCTAVLDDFFLVSLQGKNVSQSFSCTQMFNYKSFTQYWWWGIHFTSSDHVYTIVKKETSVYFWISDV